MMRGFNMKWKILVISLVLLFAVSFAWAQNGTDEITADIGDVSDYINPLSFSDKGIEFNDGFIGFCLDLNKDDLSVSDNYTIGKFSENDLENNVKLAIIESYKQKNEDNINDIVSKVVKGDTSIIEDSDNEKIGNEKVVEIDNTTEATFTFEFLKSSSDDKSDCVAYKVSTKSIEKPDILAGSNDDSLDETDNSDTPKKEDAASDNNSLDETDNSDTPKKDDAASDNATEPEDSSGNKTVNEKNTTIVNKTNTVIVNENNTTVINNNNVKTVNNTSQTPQNNTTQDLLKKAGNPILILVIVIVIIIVAVAVTRRKD